LRHAPLGELPFGILFGDLAFQELALGESLKQLPAAALGTEQSTHGQRNQGQDALKHTWS